MSENVRETLIDALRKLTDQRNDLLTEVKGVETAIGQLNGTLQMFSEKTGKVTPEVAGGLIRKEVKPYKKRNGTSLSTKQRKARYARGTRKRPDPNSYTGQVLGVLTGEPMDTDAICNALGWNPKETINRQRIFTSMQDLVGRGFALRLSIGTYRLNMKGRHQGNLGTSRVKPTVEGAKSTSPRRASILELFTKDEELDVDEMLPIMREEHGLTRRNLQWMLKDMVRDGRLERTERGFKLHSKLNTPVGDRFTGGANENSSTAPRA